MTCFIPSLSASPASGSTQIRFVQPESKLNPAQDQDGPPKARPGSVGGLKSGTSPRYLNHFFPSRDIDAHQQWSKNSCIWILYSPICCKVRNSNSLHFSTYYFGHCFLALPCLAFVFSCFCHTLAESNVPTYSMVASQLLTFLCNRLK